MYSKQAIVVVLAFLGCVLVPWQASADVTELSIGGSFSRNNYSATDFAWSRHWGASIGYHFTERSGIEFSFQDIVNRTVLTGFEDTTFHDQIFSLDWIQSLTGKNFPVQPYVKGGIGQLNRSATGFYTGGLQPALELDQLTLVLGAGMRVYLTRTFALRAEGTTYLVGGAISTWQDNFALNFGVSFMF
jgi:hypothetical protein